MLWAKNKEKTNMWFFIIIAMLFAMLFWIYSTGYKKADFEKSYVQKVVENNVLLENLDYLKDFTNIDGTLVSNTDNAWLVFGNREVLDNPLRTICIDVKHLSVPETKAKVYLVESYEVHELILREGKNYVALPKVINGGEPVSLLRFDLTNQPNIEIELNNITFNDSFAYVKHLEFEYQQISVQILITVFMLTIGLIVFKLGLSKAKLNKLGWIAGIISLLALLIMTLMRYNNNFYYYTMLVISMVLMFIPFSYYLTKLINKYNVKIFKSNPIVYLIISILSICLMIYNLSLIHI